MSSPKWVVILYNEDASPDGLEPAFVHQVVGPFDTKSSARDYGDKQPGQVWREWDVFKTEPAS